MYNTPRLLTERLILRPLGYADIPGIMTYAGSKEIAENTLSLPHPFSREDAEGFVSYARDSMHRGAGHVFAIALQPDDDFIGCIGLTIQPGHNSAELGYWLGLPHWNRGYTSESARRMIAYGFDQLGLHRIFANCFIENTASVRVLQKAGMTLEGTLRDHYLKEGVYRTVYFYGILRSEYGASRESEEADHD